jgi:hypothetical protein
MERLPSGWNVLHSVPVGTQGSDIDHVVIGPCGVFTVNAKHHPNGTVWVGGDTFFLNGKRYPYIRNARFEAQRASKMLSQLSGIPVAVTGVIAVVGADTLTLKSQPKDGIVHVVEERRLTEWLSKHGAILTPKDVSTLYHWARRSTTWTT